MCIDHPASNPWNLLPFLFALLRFNFYDNAGLRFESPLPPSRPPFLVREV